MTDTNIRLSALESELNSLKSRINTTEADIHSIKKNFDRFWEKIDKMSETMTKIGNTAEGRWSFVAGVVAAVSVIFGGFITIIHIVQRYFQ